MNDAMAVRVAEARECLVEAAEERARKNPAAARAATRRFKIGAFVWRKVMAPQPGILPNGQARRGKLDPK